MGGVHLPSYFQVLLVLLSILWWLYRVAINKSFYNIKRICNAELEKKKLSKLILKTQHFSNKQTTLDNGLGRVRKLLGQFFEIYPPIPTWNQDRVLNKLYRQILSLLFNETRLENDCCLTTHTHTHIYIYVCVYVCVWLGSSHFLSVFH